MTINLKDYRSVIHLDEAFIPNRNILNDKEREQVVDHLLVELKDEVEKQWALDLEDTYDNKRKLLYATLNALKPMTLKGNSVSLLDSLLQTELSEKGIISEKEIPTIVKIGATNVSLFKGDISTIQIDAIVNAANSQMMGCFQPLHKCIDNVIHSAAGVQLRDDCYKLMSFQRELEPTGNAKITRAYNLPSKYVIHTVGPIVNGEEVTGEHKELLSSVYTSCLEIAKESGVKSIAFCCVSTGVFGYPQDLAAQNAYQTVVDWLSENPNIIDRVVFNVFKDEDYNIYKSLIK